MTFVKQENWTEDHVNELPSGEHDYFERKSGALFDNATDRNALLDTLAKAASAFSNSGGGHLVLGVNDQGVADGLPRIFSGRTTVRDWLEQKVPQLLDYRLSDFRVHVVNRAAHSEIPVNRDVVVMDFGDSALAPHQSVRDHTYYYRTAGRSLPAPHFYLELLRQRQTSPALDFEPSGLEADAWVHEGRPILRIETKFLLENKGRVAAYKWALTARTIENVPEGRGEDYFFGELPGALGRPSSVRLDDTILPGCALTENKVFGVRLLPSLNKEDMRAELKTMLAEIGIVFQLATESSPGDLKRISFKPFVDLDRIAEMLKSKGLAG